MVLNRWLHMGTPAVVNMALSTPACGSFSWSLTTSNAGFDRRSSFARDPSWIFHSTTTSPSRLQYVLLFTFTFGLFTFHIDQLPKVSPGCRHIHGRSSQPHIPSLTIPPPPGRLLPEMSAKSCCRLPITARTPFSFSSCSQPATQPKTRKPKPNLQP